MKTKSFALLLLLILITSSLWAQKAKSQGQYGGKLNLGLGIGGYYGYYHYAGSSIPVFNINYEFDVARNFTLAPFATFYTYRNGNDHYRESIIPIGVKGSYYLDEAFRAGSNWDFYVAGSLGFVIRHSKWDDGYSGETHYQDVSPLFLDLHVGTEYHLSNRIGLFLDLSTGVSTIGLSLH